MYATNRFEEIILNLFRGQDASAPENVYLALFLSSPGESGTSGAEIAYTGYSRMPVTLSAPAEMNTTIGVKNTADVTYSRSPSAAGTVTHVGLMDSRTGGYCWIYAHLDDPLIVAADEAPVIVEEEAKFWITGDMANAYKTKVLNLLRGVDCAGFSPYLALYNGNPDEGGSELSGANYARVPLTFAAPTQQENNQMLMTNSARAATNRASTNWGTWLYSVIMDAQNAGNAGFLVARNAKEMRAGLKAIIEVGDLGLAVN